MQVGGKRVQRSRWVGRSRVQHVVPEGRAGAGGWGRGISSEQDTAEESGLHLGNGKVL